MTEFPDHEPGQVPAGRYLFQVIDEPEKRKKTGRNDKEFITILFSFKLTDDNGDVYYHKETLVPWNKNYGDLLIAFGGEKDKDGKVHLGDVNVIGKTFRAEIVHEPDREDVTKSWARIANIQIDDDVPPPSESEDEDDVPF